ncbi:MAG: MtnX-like HAD-IB family phosphatase [Candidatus Eisenbacteria bacterium]|nr:MtnX-like HAD-IB family phosphatase [Candidatus Eisenbacteria bacterium]
MKGPALVCDFDGTVVLQDVGDRFFEAFVPPARNGEWAELIRAYDSGEMGSRECLSRECAMIRATREEVHRFADRFEVEPGFARLWQAARARGVEMIVASDGLDVYIRRILDRHGLQEVPVRANRAVFEADRIRPEFPWEGLGCGRCGNCKGHHVEQFRRDHSPVVMIGDAHSDVCGALAADRVFARDILARLLAERGRACERFEDFDEVIHALSLNGVAAGPGAR